jgi:hypothetical protein
MPLALSLVPVQGQFDGCRSVMFVACKVCPRMHFAWERREPIFSPAMLLGKADGFQLYLDGLRRDACGRGQQSEVFKTPSTAAACLWSTGQGEKFRRDGAGYEAIGVIGCDSAVRTVAQIFPDKLIVQLVRVEGIANFTLRNRWPLTVEIVAAGRVPLNEGRAASGTDAGQGGTCR